jgi:hypothetical protein
MAGRGYKASNQGGLPLDLISFLKSPNQREYDSSGETLTANLKLTMTPLKASPHLTTTVDKIKLPASFWLKGGVVRLKSKQSCRC